MNYLRASNGENPYKFFAPNVAKPRIKITYTYNDRGGWPAYLEYFAVVYDANGVQVAGAYMDFGGENSSGVKTHFTTIAHGSTDNIGGGNANYDGTPFAFNTAYRLQFECPPWNGSFYFDIRSITVEMSD